MNIENEQNNNIKLKKELVEYEISTYWFQGILGTTKKKLKLNLTLNKNIKLKNSEIEFSKSKELARKFKEYKELTLISYILLFISGIFLFSINGHEMDSLIFFMLFIFSILGIILMTIMVVIYTFSLFLNKIKIYKKIKGKDLKSIYREINKKLKTKISGKIYRYEISKENNENKVYIEIKNLEKKCLNSSYDLKDFINNLEKYKRTNITQIFVSETRILFILKNLNEKDSEYSDKKDELITREENCNSFIFKSSDKAIEENIAILNKNNNKFLDLKINIVSKLIIE